MRTSPIRIVIGLIFVAAGIFLMRRQPEAPGKEAVRPAEIQPAPKPVQASEK